MNEKEMENMELEVTMIMNGAAIMRRDESLLPGVITKELLREFGFGPLIQRAGVSYMLRKLAEYGYKKGE